MREWIKTTCRFCGKEVESRYWPGDCDCEEYIKAKEEWLEEEKNSPDYREPLSEEEFEKEYPEIYYGRKTINEEEKRFIGLSCRKFEDGYGFCVFLPFYDEKTGVVEDSGLCFDFAEEHVPSFLEMLSEAVEAIEKDKKKENK
jgi:hypothetical protein